MNDHISSENGEETILAEQEISAESLYFKIEAYGQEYNFYYGESGNSEAALLKNVDGRILSTDVAGGFVGAYIGLYASSNGGVSSNCADFDWFEYSGIS
jgi:alpha-N-arabinofuranosidase